MSYKLLALLLIIVMALVFVSADVTPVTPNTDISGILDEFGILGDARVNVIDDSSGIHYGLVIADKKVASITPSVDVANPNYTLNVKPSAKTALLGANDPQKEAIAQLKAGNITVTAHGFFESIQLFFFNIYLMFQ